MELGETLQEGALRETKEETNSTVKIDDIYFMFDIPQIGQFYEDLNEGYFPLRIRELIKK